MSGTVIKSGARIRYSIIDENVVVDSDVCVVEEKGKGITVLGRNITVGKGAVVKGGEIIDKNIEAGVKI